MSETEGRAKLVVRSETQIATSSVYCNGPSEVEVSCS